MSPSIFHSLSTWSTLSAFVDNDNVFAKKVAFSTFSSLSDLYHFTFLLILMSFFLCFPNFMQ